MTNAEGYREVSFHHNESRFFADFSVLFFSVPLSVLSVKIYRLGRLIEQAFGESAPSGIALLVASPPKAPKARLSGRGLRDWT
jgi:hypothetical protein